MVNSHGHSTGASSHMWKGQGNMYVTRTSVWGWDQEAAAGLIVNRCAKLLLDRKHCVRLELQHLQVYYHLLCVHVLLQST